MKIPGMRLFAVLVVLLPPQLNAEVIRGEISAVSEDARSFDLKADEAAGQEEDLKVWLAAETRFKGLSTLPELKNGDEVTVQAQYNTSTGRWEADEVELSKVAIDDPGEEVPVPQELGEEKADRIEAAETAPSGMSADGPS